MAGNRFSTPGYDEAMHRFVWEVVDGVVALDPMLAELLGNTTDHGGPTRNISGENPIDDEMFAIEHQLVFHTDVIRYSKIDEFIVELYEMGEKVQNQPGMQLTKSIIQSTEATGNVLNSGGRPLSWDLILELIDAVELEFDDSGMMIGKPTVMLNPADAKRLYEQPVPSDFESRLQEILERKRGQSLDSKRSRRLS